MNKEFQYRLEGVSTGIQDVLPARHRALFARNQGWFLLGAIMLLLLLVWYFFLYIPTAPKSKVHAIPVNVAKAVVQDVPVSVQALGAAQAWTSVTILAQVTGKLLSVNFAEGSDVKAGQVLAQIDPAPYQAALTQAQGALKRDEALLANAKLDLARFRALEVQNAISRQQADTQAALVKQDEGTVLLDQGQVAAATVNVNWCRIVSPIDGRAGVRLVDPGNLVSASGSVSNMPSTAAATNVSSPTSNGGSGIVMINQIKPMAVTFTVPQGQFQRLLKLTNGFQTALVTKAYSQDTGALLDTGEVSIADNRVDPTTGTVQLKARFPNANTKLWPGQFVNVELMMEVLSHATTVPVAAVNQGPNGTFVYVVGANKTVSMRSIAVAWQQGNIAAIKSGIKPGEEVVTDGQMVLKPGSTIRVIQPARRRTT